MEELELTEEPGRDELYMCAFGTLIIGWRRAIHDGNIL